MNDYRTSRITCEGVYMNQDYDENQIGAVARVGINNHRIAREEQPSEST